MRLLNLIDQAPFSTVISPLLKKELSKQDLVEKIKKTPISEWNNIFKFINEEAKKYLPMRDIVIGANKTKYKRN